MLSVVEHKVVSEMKEHTSKLQSPYYEFIKDGKKIYETRVYDEKRKKMKVGDTWTFTHNSDSSLDPVRTLITDIKIYKSFREAIQATGVEKLLPQINDVEEGIKIYEAFDNGNYKIDGEMYGVVRFEIQVVNNI
jgi:ASC-1-like (ASCH) protein